MKYMIMFICLTGFAFSQVDELQLAKDALAEMAIERNELIKTNKTLTEMINTFVLDLQAIENPSEELIAVMKKYNIYKVPEIKD